MSKVKEGKIDSVKIQQAKLLTEALPYIRRFKGQTIVIKYGGSIMLDENLKNIFASDISLLKLVGINPIVVHGGGKEINKWMEKIGKTPKFIDGMRYTDEETMEITEMVLSGKLNKELVSLINDKGGNAVGISGKDSKLFTSTKINSKNGEDLGKVGEIRDCNTDLINSLVSNNYIPVVTCIAESLEGQTLNINADHAASTLGSALNALKLLYLTDVDGLKIDNKLEQNLNVLEAQALLEHKDVKGGMLPKLKYSIEAIKNGVDHVQMINGTIEHAVLLELFTDSGIGTKISYNKR